jgi:hypothetical protein
MNLFRAAPAVSLAVALASSALAQTNPGTSPLSGSKGGTGNAFMQFSGPASSIKTYTLPNASDTVAMLGAIQTFTAAKTFASSKFLLGGSSSGTTTLNAAATASGTLTLPAATDTLVGKATTDTLTNKTFDTAGTGNSLLINGVAATANNGTGAIARSTSPVFVTPTIGAASATTVNGITITPSTGTLTLNTNTLGVAGSGIALTVGGPAGTMTFQGTDTYVGRATTDTLTNKTLTTPVISSITNTGTLTLPTSTDTLVGRATTDTLTNKTISGPNLINPAVTGVATFVGSSSGTTSVQASAVAGTTALTLPAATDTLVGKATTDTLTNKTLTTPVISSITNTGTLTLPTSTDTLVGRATTDTLTNKTLTNAVVGTQSAGDNSTKAASTAYADAIAALKVSTTRNVSTGCGLAGGGDLSADRTLRLSLTINSQTGTTYTVVDGDCGKLIRLNNASSVAVTLPQANGSTFISGWTADFQNIGAGAVTITPTTSTVNGGANLVLTTNQGAHCDSDGTNYTCVLGVGNAGGSGVTSIVAGTGLSGGTITSSGTIALTDEYRQNLLLDRIYQAKAFVGYRRFVNAFADGYKSATDDGINSGSSSNYTTASGSGNVTNTTTSTRLSGGTPTATLGGTAANINDNNTGTSITVSPGNLSGTAAPTSRTLAYIDYGSNQTITKIEAVGLSISFGPSSAAGGFFYSTDGTSWTQLGASPTVTTSAATYSATGSVTARYVGWIVPQNNFGAATYTLQDLNGYINQPNNMTVVTTAQTADASVSNGRVLLEFDNTATPTLNTDLTAEVTCNGGTNWASATLSSVSTNGQAGHKIAETADTPCTSGTSFAARIKTANNKLVAVYGTSLTVH